jgi:hypothetical protein
MGDQGAFATDVERVLALTTVREAADRSAFLAAIRELGRDGGDFSLERLQQLIRVEDHFQALLLYGQLDFIKQPFAVSESDRDFALNIQRICLEAANGFQRFLRNRASWARTREALDTMFQVTGLAVDSIHCFVKWGYFLNETGRSAPWKQMHALYALADADGYADAEFELHASQPSFRSSVQSLYLRALLLDLINTGNLGKVHIEIADGWFAGWSRDYALDRGYDPRQHLFCVDLASDSGMHLVRRQSQGDTVRYMRAESLRAQIDQRRAELRQGYVQVESGAGGMFPIEDHAALLGIVEKLNQSIVAGGQARIEERTTFEDREVDVVIGIERVMRKTHEAPEPGAVAARPAVSEMEVIDISPTGLSVISQDPHIAAATVDSSAADPHIERWRVLDLSARGYGLLVDRAAAEAVALNGLLAVRNHETGGWIIGSVVRKQPSRGRAEVLVGVEILAYRPIPTALRFDDKRAVPALFLPGLDPGGKRDSLLLPLGDFRSGSRFVIGVAGSDYSVRVNRIIRKGADWINARFEIESKA